MTEDEAIFISDNWTKSRTCSRVSGGECDVCHKETPFAAYHFHARGMNHGRHVLCVPCWEKRFDRPAAERRKKEQEAAERDREERAKFAREEVRRRREGLPPVNGWHREGTLIVNDETSEKRGFF